MAESQRTTWLLSMPACAEVNGAMQDVAQTFRLTSEQHKELGLTRTAQDTEDMVAITSLVCERDPFSGDASWRNIATCVVAHSAVNVDNAKQVGPQILQAMEGQTASEVTLKKKDHAVTMSAKSSVRIDGCPVQVDPQLLFQRLVAAANNKNENTKSIPT